MLHPTHKIGLAVILGGLLLLPNAMWGQKGKPREIQDEAKLFGEKAIENANAIIAKIKEKHQKDLWIETVEKGPEKAVAAKWAEKRASTAGIDGVYIVITTQPRLFEIVVGNKTRDKGYFTNANRDEVKKILAKNLKDNRDEALVKIAQYTLDTMDEATKKSVPRLVKDEAKLFSEDAVKDANAIVVKIRETHQKDLFIETLEKGPSDAKEFATWTRDRAGKLGVNGVYVLITTEPKHFQVDVDDKTKQSGLFTISDRDEMVKMLRGLGKDRDETLLKVANYALEAMNQRKKPDEK
jgi:hypothetical protein